MDTLAALCSLLFLLLIQNAAILGQLDNSIRGSGSPPPAKPPAPTLRLQPSTPSITHFVNDSFIIFCQTVQKDIDTKWRDPRGQTRENTKGRVHIEKKTMGLLALVFEHISLDDRGNWTCEVNGNGNGNRNVNVEREFLASFELLVNQNLIWEDGASAVGARGTRCDGQLLCGGNAHTGSVLALQWRIYKHCELIEAQSPVERSLYQECEPGGCRGVHVSGDAYNSDFFGFRSNNDIAKDTTQTPLVL
ncbi:uncharacterized protein [Drosophila bipectinata]|uniref:uncharacterized protein isoform X3 n=1 Tax=Drosophila bipectinata TaxID=42026 RepID=UPI0038B37B25